MGGGVAGAAVVADGLGIVTSNATNHRLVASGVCKIADDGLSEGSRGEVDAHSFAMSAYGLGDVWRMKWDAGSREKDMTVHRLAFWLAADCVGGGRA